MSKWSRGKYQCEVPRLLTPVLLLFLHTRMSADFTKEELEELKQSVEVEHYNEV